MQEIRSMLFRLEIKVPDGEKCRTLVRVDRKSGANFEALSSAGPLKYTLKTE